MFEHGKTGPLRVSVARAQLSSRPSATGTCGARRPRAVIPTPEARSAAAFAGSRGPVAASPSEGRAARRPWLSELFRLRGKPHVRVGLQEEHPHDAAIILV